MNEYGSRTVVLSLLLAFGTFAVAGDSGVRKLTALQGYLAPNAATSAKTTIAPIAGGSPGGVSPALSVWTPQALFGWMAVFVFLIILSDFDTTAQLADAFALLILLTTLLAVGPEALKNITSLTGSVNK